MLSGMIAFPILAGLTMEKLFFGHAIGHRPLLQMGILLMILGVQLVSTGLIGELINYNSKSQSQKGTQDHQNFINIMQFIDIKTIHQHSATQIDEAVAKVFEHGRYINGPEVYELEATLGEFLGGSHCVAVASGTMALEVALRALGYRPG